MKGIYFLVLTLFATSLYGQVKKTPNIIIIISDDHALSTIGAYGAK